MSSEQHDIAVLLCCRPDAITVPDLDEFFGGRLNLALMNPFAASVHLDEYPVKPQLQCPFAVCHATIS